MSGPNNVPSDRTATSKEISDAILTLTDAEYNRLQLFAEKRTVFLKALKGDQDWAEEILQEALMKIQSGEKKWPIEKIFMEVEGGQFEERFFSGGLATPSKFEDLGPFDDKEYERYKHPEA